MFFKVFSKRLSNQMMINMKKLKIIIRNKCIDKNIILKALTIIPKKDMRNLTIVFSVYPPKTIRKKRSIIRWRYNVIGEYNTKSYNNKKQVCISHVYLGPEYEQRTNAFFKPFFRQKLESVLETMYHEIGHHHQFLINRFAKEDKYRTDFDYRYKSEQNAEKYAGKMLKKAKVRGIIDEIPITFTKKGYIASRRFKEQKAVINRIKKITKSDMAILHEIRAMSVNAEFSPAQIIHSIYTKLPAYIHLFYCDYKRSYMTSGDYEEENCHYLQTCKKLKQTTRKINKYAREHGMGLTYTDHAGRRFLYFTYNEHNKIVNHFAILIKKHISPKMCTRQ